MIGRGSSDGGRPARFVFFLLAEPDEAERIAERGLTAAGVWNAGHTVTLLDRAPEALGGGVLRVVLPAETAEEVLRRESSESGEGFRKFSVPLALLADAHVSRADR